jgi:hypothetical protein
VLSSIELVSYIKVLKSEQAKRYINCKWKMMMMIVLLLNAPQRNSDCYNACILYVLILSKNAKLQMHGTSIVLAL